VYTPHPSVGYFFDPPNPLKHEVRMNDIDAMRWRTVNGMTTWNFDARIDRVKFTILDCSEILISSEHTTKIW
jgi:hypothetical protein